MKLAGAYWRGDSTATRCCSASTARPGRQEGAARPTCTLLEEAEKRDHRKLGHELDLFHTQDESARAWCSGTPRAGRIWQQVEQYMRDSLPRQRLPGGAQAPQILDRTLWEKTGHWDKYRDNMFTTESEKRDYALKPMNCPGHIQIFNQGLQELPRPAAALRRVRLVPPQRALGRAARHHARARLHAGRRPYLLHRGPDPRRVRGLHATAAEVYRDFGFSDVIYKLSTRPEKRIGSDEVWDKAEQALMESLRRIAAATVEICAGRGRLLRPEDRVHAARTASAGTGSAARCRSISRCPSAWAPSTSPRTTATPDAGDAAPRHRRLPGALHRHPDRAARRRASRCGWRRCRRWS